MQDTLHLSHTHPKKNFLVGQEAFSFPPFKLLINIDPMTSRDKKIIDIKL